MVSNPFPVISSCFKTCMRCRLYVSPKLPPTPVQKKVPPLQWLSEGHNKGGKATEGLPSLDDVRKSLIYNIDEAENLGDVPGYSSS